MEFNLETIQKIIRRSWKSFLLSFILVIIMHIINMLNFHPISDFLSPLSDADTPANYSTMMDAVIRPKLQKVENDYSLNYQKSDFFPQADAAEGALNDAPSYILVDFDSGDVITEKQMQTRLPIASLTKIMTAVISLDLANRSELFSVTQNAADQIPSKIGLVPGQKITVEELLNALLLTSANDAAEELKDGINAKYGEEVFIQAMNEKAQLIGLKNSSFANPQGFDDQSNFSTVEDLAILSHYALKNYPLIEEIVKKDYEYLPEDENHKEYDLNNWNGLIGVYPETIGIKIGNTGDAGKTTVVVANRNGKKMLAVVLGAPGLFERDMWAAGLLDYGYGKLLGLDPINITKTQLQTKYDSWYASR